MHDRLDVSRPGNGDPGRRSLGRTRRLQFTIAAEDGVDNDLAGLLDSEELVLRMVELAEVWSGNTLVAHIVVRTVEALVTHADDLNGADIAEDVLVHGAPARLGPSGAIAVAGGLSPAAAVVLAYPVKLRIVRGLVHREERVRNVVPLAFGRV